VNVEAGLVLAGRRQKPLAGELEGLVAELGITVGPFGEKEAHAAVEAFRRYGHGRHRAALNFGDCLAYAPNSQETACSSSATTSREPTSRRPDRQVETVKPFEVP
jgi:uncharacterized protein with PIN domain